MLEPREMNSWRTLTATMIRHAANDDPEAFAQVVAILAEAQALLPAAAAQLLTPSDQDKATGAGAYSWADIGAALGVSRQAARQKYGKA